MKPRNVIFITSDQQQAGAMGCADPSFVTPQIDALASRGVRFTHAISTSAQCTPARASWETGRYPHEVGVNQIGHAIRPELPMVAKEFSQAQYETVHFGKWHLFTHPSRCGYQVTEYPTDGVEPWLADMGNLNRWSVRDAIATAQAIRYIRDAGPKPFFMALSYYCPHPGSTKFELIDAFRDEYPLERMPVPRSFYEDDLRTKPPFQKERADSAECRLTEEQVRIDAQKYRTMVSYLDSNVGRVLDELERKGILQDTAIVFSSDHGDLQGAHRLRLKGVLPYKELYNVPLIVVDPDGRAEGRVSDRLVSSAGVPGTLLDLAGLPVPAAFAGGVLPYGDVRRAEAENGVLPDRAAEAERGGGSEEADDEHVFFEHYKAYWGFHPFYGIQTREWKYVYYYQEDMEEMYDLARDPDELVNVANRPDIPAVKTALKARVSSWWQATGALTVPPVKAAEVGGAWGSLV